MRNFFLLFFCFVSSAFITSAQTGDIRGFVYERETSEPSIYTSVYLKGTTYGGQTNLDGFFTITRVPPGEYTLMITSVGYDTIRQPVSLKSGDILTKKIYLEKSVIEFREVQISAESQEKKTEVQVSVNKITPKEIRQVPSIGGEPDLAQYLQVLPGVITSGDQGGQLYIRGGTPIQNKVLLDGMVIYNPFHSIGFFSVFDPDIIRGVDVYTGGFNADYGGRISSIMDITTRDGNKKRMSGKLSSTTFTSKIIFEGPLKKANEGEEGSSSFILAAKTSYLDKSSKTFYSYIDSAGLPYSFNDLYGKISFNSSTGSKFNIFGFHFEDKVKYQHIADLGWKTTGFGTNFVLVPNETSVLIEGNFAYSKYSIGLTEADAKPRASDISGFNGGLNFTYFIDKNEFKYGLEVLGFRTNYDFYNNINLHLSQIENTTELAGYLKYKAVVSKLVIEPGFRFDYYASLSEFSAEPRIGAKYNVSDKFRLKMAGGFYAQNLLSTSSDRDVVNLFYGFLSGSDNLPETFNGGDITSRLQTAKHAIAGFELDLPHHLTLNVEAYIKDFTQLEVVNRDKIYDDNSLNSYKPDSLKKDFVIETGIAKGVDFLLKYDYRRLYLWFVYSLGFVNRFDGSKTYEPSFDRRHNVNLVAAYTFGKKQEWEVNARLNFGSPFPFTQTQGFYEQLNFNAGIPADILHQNGQEGIIYGPLNSGRMSYFHRLDISAKRTFHLSKNSELAVTASVTNVYDRKNIFYVNRVTGDRIYQLPVLPSLGISWTF
ncbi:MAG: TonB-dependent receptor [Bacteroidetes bacterium]|nr:TonB-dependent receptor [Bacteroidota bacterium]